jgi:hypothetical protein
MRLLQTMIALTMVYWFSTASTAEAQTWYHTGTIGNGAGTDFHDVCTAYHGGGRTPAWGLWGYVDGGYLTGVGAFSGNYTPLRGFMSGQFRRLTCDGSLNLKGIRGYADSIGPTSVGMTCVDPGGNTIDYGFLGSVTTTQYSSHTCSRGYTASGVHGKVGVYLSRIGLICDKF